jgi:hypothetical protein
VSKASISNSKAGASNPLTGTLQAGASSAATSKDLPNRSFAVLASEGVR